MNGRDFHKILKYDNLLKSRPINSGSIRLAYIRHYWSTGDPVCGLHVFPFPSNQQNTVQPEYFLKSLGFESHSRICSYLVDVDSPHHNYQCHTQWVPEDFDVFLFINSFNSVYLRLVRAQEELNQCGIYLDQQAQTYGDGHTGVPTYQNGRWDDDIFSSKFTLLENDGVNSWTIHSLPKHPPLSPELQAALAFLGIREFPNCPEHNSESCYWRSVSFEIETFDPIGIPIKRKHDNGYKVRRWLEAHKDHFSSGIEKLIAANAEMKKSGIEFLNTDALGKHLVNTDIEPSLGKPKTQSPTTYNYEVAISFAGTERKFARELAEFLKAKGVLVFWDEFNPDKLWGKNMVEYFDLVFRKDSRYCVVFVSKDYQERAWTRHEFRSAQARALEERGDEYILPIKVDDTELDGLPPTINHLSIDRGIEEIGEILIKKLQS